MALLIGFEPMDIVFWKIFSQRPAYFKRIKVGRKIDNADDSQKYHLFEKIVDELRIQVKKGLKSFILVTPEKKDYATLFLDHINSHHKWLVSGKSPRSAKFSSLQGSIPNKKAVLYWLQTQEFQDAIQSTIKKEAEDILELLERRIDQEEGLVLFSLREIESLLYSGGTKKKKFKDLPIVPEYILVTNEYIDATQRKHRVQRLLQIAKNRKIKTKIIDGESDAGKRITQLGGIVCFMQTLTKYQKKKGEELINPNRQK